MIRLLRRWRRDDGSAALETVILAPPMLALIALAIIGMRIEIAGGAIEGAAHDAARAASISRSSSQAHAAAVTTAHDSLHRQGLRCAGLDVAVDTSGFAAEPGQPATVRVVISCMVTFADVAAPGIPGGKRMQAEFVSTIDIYRGRS